MNIKSVKIKGNKVFDMQRRIVSYMTSESWRNIPHVTYIYEPDITEFHKEFSSLAKKGITFNTVMIKVITEGLLASPILNSFLEYNYKKSDGSLYICSDINISVPWLLPDGRMITLLIPCTNRMKLKEINSYVENIKIKISKTNIDEMLYKSAFLDAIEEIRRFHLGTIRRIISAKIGKHKIKNLTGKEKIKYYSIPENERLTERDVLNGTVTISNIGSLYKGQKGFLGLLEIIPPQILAVGIGAVQEKPGVYIDRDGIKKIGIRKTLPMCIAFDHRAVDFNDLIPFLKKIDEIFEGPNVICNW